MRGGARWGCEDTACLWQLGRGNARSWEQGGVAVVAGRPSAGVEGTLALVFPQGASGRGTGEGRGLQCKDPVFWRQGSDRTGGGPAGPGRPGLWAACCGPGSQWPLSEVSALRASQRRQAWGTSVWLRPALVPGLPGGPSGLCCACSHSCFQQVRLLLSRAFGKGPALDTGHQGPRPLPLALCNTGTLLRGALG